MSVQLTDALERAFTGRRCRLSRTFSDAETALYGEAVATAFLYLRVREVRKAGLGHYAIDLLATPWAVEVKAGLVSNVERAQVWRLTIGEPSPDERAWLRKAEPAEKRHHNNQKRASILERKVTAVRALERQVGTPLRAITVTAILHPDRQLVDVFEFDGFHERIAWVSAQATKGYRGSFHYEVTHGR